MRVVLSLLIAAVVGMSTMAAPASAAKPVSGSLTTMLTVAPTTLQTDLGEVTVSGELTAEVTRFSLNQQGDLVAVATLSGTLTASTLTLGTATVVITSARVILRASVEADCSGNLRIDFTGVVQLDATVTFTDAEGTATTTTIDGTVPLRGSLDFTAETMKQRSLICDISKLLANRSSQQALVDKLSQLLKTL